MHDILEAIKKYGYQIKWWHSPLGWSVTTHNDEHLVGGLSDSQLEEWCSRKIINGI